MDDCLFTIFTHLVAVVPGLDDHVLAGDGAAQRGGRGAVRGRHELGLLALGAPIGARVSRLVEGSGHHTYTQPGISAL